MLNSRKRLAIIAAILLVKFRTFSKCEDGQNNL